MPIRCEELPQYEETVYGLGFGFGMSRFGMLLGALGVWALDMPFSLGAFGADRVGKVSCFSYKTLNLSKPWKF